MLGWATKDLLFCLEAILGSEDRNPHGPSSSDDAGVWIAYVAVSVSAAIGAVLVTVLATGWAVREFGPAFGVLR